MIAYTVFQPLQEIEVSDDMASLYQYYKFSGKEEEIVLFVLRHNLVSILVEATREIKSVFKKNLSFLELKLQQDPEENFKGLFIIIHTDLPSRHAVEVLDKLDEKWWLYMDDEVSNVLEITVRANEV